MRTTSWELELPIDDGSATDIAQRRLAHLAAVGGVDAELVPRLARAFRSLRAVYEASETDLARQVGAVAAARIRWFLDAPLDTSLAADVAPAVAESFADAA